jgi:hypothetical protein
MIVLVALAVDNCWFVSFSSVKMKESLPIGTA